MASSAHSPQSVSDGCSICGSSPAPGLQERPTCADCDRLLEWLRDHLARQFGVQPDQIGAGTSLDEDLGADSVDRAELVMELEEHVGVIVPDEEATRIRTVGDAIQCIRQATPRESGPAEELE